MTHDVSASHLPQRDATAVAALGRKVDVGGPNADALAPPTMTPASTLALLDAWSDQGWLRRLDSAMARFMGELDPNASPQLLVCTAILTQMEGRGHTCLRLRQWVDDATTLLAWPAAAQAALQALQAQWPHPLEAWVQALSASPLVRLAEQAPDLGQPLVLSQRMGEPLLYLRRYWLHEQCVAQELLQRCSSTETVDHTLAADWLAKLFGPGDPDRAAEDFNWQKFACAAALRARLTVITGGPGTGKTYTAARLLALLLATSAAPQNLRVALAAPTGKAAARLRQAIDASLQELGVRLGDGLGHGLGQGLGQGLDLNALAQRIGPAKTLHALLGARLHTREFTYNARRLLDVDVLIVDEASMIHLEMMSALLQALPPHTRLVLLGDKDQLASVEAGAVLGDVCRSAVHGHYLPATVQYAQALTGETLPPTFAATGGRASALAQQTVMLRKSQRFGGKIGALASAIHQGDGASALALLHGDSAGVLQAPHQPTLPTLLALAVHGREGAPLGYAQYLRLLTQRPKQQGSVQGEPATLQPANLGAPHHQTPGEVGTSHTAWVMEVLTAFERFRILCAVHDGEWGTRNVNRQVQRTLEREGLLRARGEWYAGRPVMVTRNDPALGVFNGDVGVALYGPDGTGKDGQPSALRVYFMEGDGVRSVSVSRLAHVETAFAMSVHKSQGSEFAHTVLVLPPHAGALLSKELVYTGLTRARQYFTLISPQPDTLRDAVSRPTERASGLQALLDAPA